MLNEIKNTPSKGKIIVYLIDNDDYVDVSVKNPGVGLTEKEKQKLFQNIVKLNDMEEGWIL